MSKNKLQSRKSRDPGVSFFLGSGYGVIGRRSKVAEKIFELNTMSPPYAIYYLRKCPPAIACCMRWPFSRLRPLFTLEGGGWSSVHR